MSLLRNFEVWCAHPEYYDYINVINFYTNNMALGGGQSMNLDCDMKWTADYEKIENNNEPPLHDYTRSTAAEKGTIKIEYIKPRKTEPRRRGRSCCPEFDDLNRWNSVKYTIYKGNYIFEAPFYRTLAYNYRIIFDENPMPSYRSPSLFLMLESPAIFDVNIYYPINSPERVFDHVYFDKMNEWYRNRQKKRRLEKIPYDQYQEKRSKHAQLIKLYVKKYFPHEI